MAAKTLPDIDQLRKLLRYEPDTGKLYWKNRPREMFEKETEHRRWNTRYAGAEALTGSNKHGYRYGRINYSMYKAHRVAWAIHYGAEPGGGIDHINGDRSDNRICNLRIATPSENCKNRKMRSDNPGLHPGVAALRNGKFLARITSQNVRHNLGTFSKYEDAVKARKDAEIKYNFHPNHGRKQQTVAIDDSKE